MNSLLAIDPGACTGWAVFHGTTLRACGACSPDTEVPPCDEVVIENPQIYPRSPARPRDILTLARIVGRYQERYKDQKTHLVEPHEWKGSIKKAIMIARIRKNLTALEKYILALCPSSTDDTIDAIGLGKYWLSLR